MNSLKKTPRITIDDIKRINYIYYTSFRHFVKKPHNLLICYILFFLRFLQSIFFSHKYKAPCKELLFFAPTLNNRKSLRPIAKRLPLNLYDFWDEYKWNYPYTKIYLASFRHIFTFQHLYNKSSKEDKELIRTYYNPFMMTCGTYEVFDKMLEHNKKTRMIIIANDHSTMERCLIEASRKHKVKTLYVQHASVTKRFPPLCFTYSFLDGLESYTKYKRIGEISGSVFLSGSPRFDEIAYFKNNKVQFELGIALNMLDSCEKVLNLCKYLQEKGTKSILVRPHPRMGKQFDATTFRQIGVCVSDSIQESSFSFLSKVKCLIANESSIHLDSALIGVPSLLYNFSESDIKDWYSYIKNGMITVCSSYDDVVQHLNGKLKLPVEKIRYYNSAFKTQYEGRTGELIASFIFHDISEPEGGGLGYISQITKQNIDGYFEYKD